MMLIIHNLSIMKYKLLILNWLRTSDKTKRLLLINNN